MMCKDLNDQFTGYHAPARIAARRDQLKAKLEQMDALYLEATEQRELLEKAHVRARTNRYLLVKRLHDRGLGWAEIGRKLGITRAGAQWIFQRGKGGNAKKLHP